MRRSRTRTAGVRCRRAGRARADVQHRRRGGDRRRDRVRAGAGRRRLHPRAAGVRAGLRRLCDSTASSSSPTRCRPVRAHGPAVRHGAHGRGARPDLRRQVDRERPPALRRRRPRRGDGRARARRCRRHLRRQSGRAGGRARGAGRDRRGGPGRPLRCDRRDDPRSHARLAGAVAVDRRRSRPRLDAGDRVRRRPGDEGAGQGAGAIA